MNTNIIKEPNIFDYATSELSQDAFICWLLSWADPKYKNSSLNDCAVELLNKLTTKDSDYIIKTIVVEKQKIYKINNIKIIVDIQVIINKTIAIIIEDKVNASMSCSQKSLYKNIKIKGIEDKNIKFIYLKTGFQLNYKNEESSGFKIFNRQNFLNILKKYKDKTTNNVFVDFYKHLNTIEERRNSYEIKDVSEWRGLQWQGFFTEIHKSLDGDGRYVHNPSGGFYGYWWKYDSKKPYLQIEKNDLFIKIQADSCSEIRKEYYKYINDKDKKNIFIKPSSRRWKSKGTMTLFKLKDGYMILENGKINLEKTLNRLESISEIFSEIIS